MEGVSTDSLRTLAPQWSLAGDDQLLSLLQNTHQKLISKCQDVNSKLEEMASALDGASINLQNVNNKFMALSNSQFIESRVYEDEVDLATDVQPSKVVPQPRVVDEISMLKSSLAILERSHETAEILDDSDSDSDAEISVVLKPKDMYAHRPLPYIIGSQHWKNKWHAGLIVEDSDTDSSTSKQDRDIDQYSDSEEEITRPPLEEENTVSESSSSLPGSIEAGQPASRPADIAAALARRLAGDATTRVEEDIPERSPPAPAQVTKVYKPEKPATSAIFSDEPPPLDDSTDQSSDEDIFAEINKNTPYTQRNKDQSNLAEDLFSFEKPIESGDIFSDFAQTHVEKQSAKQKSTLFEGESEPELFAEPPKKVPQSNTEKDETRTKKPVGGISLFGSNKGAENIGAAILKRNQRKSSTSGDESDSDDFKTQNDNITKPIPEKPRIADRNNLKSAETTDEIDNTSKSMGKREKDIFDDLFSKPENKQKTATAKPVKPKVTPVKENVVAVKEKEKTNIKDLFSDNIFDDIDDIFTSNVKIPPKESNQKSIFADDDLFSDIDIATTSQKKDNKESGIDNNYVKDIKSKSIFDSDDELFSDIKTDNVSKNIESHSTKVEEDKNRNSEVVSKTGAIKKPIETTKERNLFDDSPQLAKSDPKPQIKTKSIFDSDSDDDIFAKIKTNNDNKTDKGENVLETSKNDIKTLDEENLFKADSTNKKKNLLTTDSLKTNENVDRSPSLFDEEEIDDLFIAANKLKAKENRETNVIKIVEENNPSEREKDNSSTSHIVSKPEEIKNSEPEKIPNIVPNKDDIFGDNDDDLFTKSKEDLVNEPNDKISKDIKSTNEENKSEEKRSSNAKLNTIIESQIEHSDDTLFNVDLNKTQEIEQENVKQPVSNNVTPVKKNEEKHEPKIPAPSDIFDDIFTEPPAFEKPAEPKKSKNINALFDDDSDDESLFFKKSDVISDEKPEIFSQNANFDIFVDEPPAIDVDFSPKTAENTEINDDLFSIKPQADNTLQTNVIKEDEDIFSPEPEVVPKFKELDDNKTVPGTQNVPDNVIEFVGEKTIDDKPTSNEVSKSKPKSDLFGEEDKDLFSPGTVKSKENPNIGSKDIESDEELFASLPSLPKSSQKNQTNTAESNKKATVERKESDDFDDIFKSKSPEQNTEVKKIGKINTKNFNINVNALIPGASPKKIPKESKDEQKPELDEPKTVKLIPDETDFEPKLTKNKNESEVADLQVQESTKSITFDDKSDPSVLDNNLSKQRPKIQVKRRPSTRKARHEAVRKSAIDFGDDTDNSSSLDEPKPRSNRKEEKSINQNEENINKQDIFGHNIDAIDTNITKETKNVVNESNITKKDGESIKSLPKEKDIIEETKTTKEIKNTEEKRNSEEKSDIFESILTNIPKHNEPVASNSNETISTQNLNENKQKTTKIVYILNDEDIFNTNTENTKNIFDPVDSQIFNNTEGIKTLGRTYKEETENKRKEETPVKDKITKREFAAKDVKSQKQSLFDDSDEELFNKSKRITKKVTIFDSDSEEDLFSGKKSSEKKNKEVRNKEVKERKEVKETKAVVKGSLFGDDDDDDDLFGVKKNITEPKPQASTPSTSKDTSTLAATLSKTAEPVFNDPLSMLGEDDL